jgi:glycerol kinase
MAKHVLAIDNGTTSTRAIVFDDLARKVSTAQLETHQVFPEAGWVEQDPRELWENTRVVLTEALESAHLSPTDISAIGITTQRETTIMWNKKTGEPIYNAIVWQDTRTQEWMSRLADSVNGLGLLTTEQIREKTGLPWSAYFSASKIRWVLDHVDGARELADTGELLFGTPDTWLLWNLTGGVDGGVHATDVTGASRTLLMNLESLEWDDELLHIFGVPRSVLPTIKPSSSEFGIAREPLPRVPVTALIGDQQAATFGQGCFTPGTSKNTYGTGNFLMINTGEKPVLSQHGLITTVAYQLQGSPARYALEGSVAVSGSLIQWLRDNLGIISEAQEVESLALSVPNNGDVYVVPAFSGLYAPYWRADARGVIVGLTRYATKAHIARASLEAVAFQSREILDAVIADSGVQLTELRVDGGMVANEFLMQFQANVLGVPVVRPVITETTALGAAFAAGLAVGVWKSTDVLTQLWQESKRWNPTTSLVEREKLLTRWKKAVSRSFDWVETAD